MVNYQLKITESAERELREFHKKLQDRIVDKILKLGENPRLSGSKKLLGTDNYRIRVGDYRIYSIDNDKRTITILDIGHRKDIYRQIFSLIEWLNRNS